MGILANGTGTITAMSPMVGGRLYYTSMDNVGTVLRT